MSTEIKEPRVLNDVIVDPEFDFNGSTEQEKRDYQRKLVNDYIQNKNKYIQEANEYATKELQKLMEIINILGFVRLQEPINVRCDITGSLLYKGQEMELSQVLNELLSETERDL